MVSSLAVSLATMTQIELISKSGLPFGAAFASLQVLTIFYNASWFKTYKGYNGFRASPVV